MTGEPARRLLARLGGTAPWAALFMLSANLADALTSAWMIGRLGAWAESNRAYAAFVVAPSPSTLWPVLGQESAFFMTWGVALLAWAGVRSWRLAPSLRARAARAVSAVLATTCWGYGLFILTRGAGVNFWAATGEQAWVPAAWGPLAAALTLAALWAAWRRAGALAA